MRVLTILLIGVLPFCGTTSAQSGTIPTGVSIPVRTTDSIDVNKGDGQVFNGVVDQDVQNTQGGVAIPRGANVELLVRTISNESTLDLDSVFVNGERYAVEAENAVVEAKSKSGIGANKRTGEYVGGGALIGAIVGAIAGGGKGAAIGGGVGAAAGAGTQVLTKGKSVKVPSETLVTFRLEQPLHIGIADSGFSRNGRHYHNGYGTVAGNSTAYDAGLQAGRADRERNIAYNSNSNRWQAEELRDYQNGYERGYDESPRRGQAGPADLRISADHYIVWKAPAASKVYVQIDDQPKRLFASGLSGNQPAPWMTSGHRYLFILEDSNGREIARDENDLRTVRTSRR
jgi:hypothetical protein